MRRQKPAPAAKTPRPPRRFVFVAACVLSALLLGLLALERPVARWSTRRWMGKLKGVEGDFLDARLSFFPLAYRVTHLKLSQPERETREPLLYADDISLRLLWGPLLLGRLVARIQAQGVKVVLEQPAPGTPTRLPDLSRLIPVRVLLERLEARHGQVLYVWVHQKGRPTMWFHDIEATLENVASRAQTASGPLTLAATGTVQRSGTMSVVVQAEPYVVPLTFRGQASLDAFDVAQMNGLIESQKGVKLSPGLFSLRMTFESKAGRLNGSVAPHLEASKVLAQDANPLSTVTALLGQLTLAVAPQPDGTTPNGAFLVRDELTEPDRQLLPSMEKVVENGFLLGLQEGLRRQHSLRPSGPDSQPEKHPTELQTGK